MLSWTFECQVGCMSLIANLLLCNVCQGDRGSAGERGVKGIKGESGDPGTAGQPVSHTADIFIGSFIVYSFVFGRNRFGKCDAVML